jgi:peptide/nickel transport system permease protein
MKTKKNMVGSAVGQAGFSESIPRVSEFQRFRRVFFGRPVVIFGFVIISLLVFAAVFASFISPYDPYQPNLTENLRQPSLAHWLGTDNLGRDVVSRLIFGTRVSLMVGFVSVGVATVVGMTLGLLAGYFGKWLDAILMRIIDGLMMIPPIILALVFAAVLGGGLKNVMIAMGIAITPSYCRLMRGQVLSIKQSDYILMAHAVGSNDTRIMARHILPNCLPPLLVLITLNLGGAILAEAALSFLGIGVTPPTAAWGNMVYDGQKYVLHYPFLSFAPGVCIMLVVLAFNMIGDGLRDALDPRLRGTL